MMITICQKVMVRTYQARRQPGLGGGGQARVVAAARAARPVVPVARPGWRG